ncbi:hypothetical protein V5799_022396, partial [Amblyomma americanum]
MCIRLNEANLSFQALRLNYVSASPTAITRCRRFAAHWRLSFLVGHGGAISQGGQTLNGSCWFGRDWSPGQKAIKVH